MFYKNVLQIRRRTLRDQNDEAIIVDHYYTKIEECVEIFNRVPEKVSMNWQLQYYTEIIITLLMLYTILSIDNSEYIYNGISL